MGWDLLQSTCTADVEVCMFTLNEDTKGNAKCRNYGVLGG